MAEYILRSMSRFDGDDPAPFAGCAGIGVSVVFADVLSGLAAFDRFLLFVTIYRVPRNPSLYRRKIFAVDVQDAALNSRSERRNIFGMARIATLGPMRSASRKSFQHRSEEHTSELQSLR